jgi:hypothetical protein
METNGEMPYWNVNVPEKERTAACPDFLVGIHERDRQIISTPDCEYRIQSWDAVREFVSKNELENFKRVPSELRRYKAFTYQLARRYGSVTNFMLTERLRWDEPVQARGLPFEYPDDYKILYNDWPYGIDPRIVHLVVWTKFSIDEDPDTGKITNEAKAALDGFMNNTFLPHVPHSRVCQILSSPYLHS